MAQKVVQRQLLRALFGDLFNFFAVEGLLRLFDKRHHVAHAQNAARHAVGMKWLNIGKLLAGTAELNGLADHGFDGKRRAAACVAVQLGQNHAVDAQLLIEGLGDVDSVLAGHRVHHEQDFLRLDGRLHAPQLLHQLRVDMKAAGGIDDQHVAAVAARMLNGLQRGFNGVLRAVLIHRHLNLLANHLQLLDGGGAVNIARRQKRLFACLLQIVGQLARHGGLTRALKAAKHINGRNAGRPREPRVFRTHQGGHFFINNLDHLLSRGQAFQYLLPYAPLGDPFAKIFDDQIVNVGFQQGDAHLAHALLHGGLRQLAAPRQLGERAGKLLAESFKGHGRSPPLPAG